MPSCRGSRAAGCRGAAGCAASLSSSRSGGASCGRSAPPHSSSPSSHWRTRHFLVSPGETPVVTYLQQGLAPSTQRHNPLQRGCSAQPTSGAGVRCQNSPGGLVGVSDDTRSRAAPGSSGKRQHSPFASPDPPPRPPAPRCKPYPRAEPVGHATSAPPGHAGRGHHLLLCWRLGPGGDDAHCRANRNTQLNAGLGTKGRVPARYWSPWERDVLITVPYPC